MQQKAIWCSAKKRMSGCRPQGSSHRPHVTP